MRQLSEAMRRGSFVLAVWGVNLLVLWVVAWAVFEPDTETVVGLGAASAAVFALAAWARVREARAGEPADLEPGVIHDSSHSTALAGAAITGLALSAEFGPWLAYVSGGALVVALGGLVRERRAARATLARVRGNRP